MNMNLSSAWHQKPLKSSNWGFRENAKEYSLSFSSFCKIELCQDTDFLTDIAQRTQVWCAVDKNLNKQSALIILNSEQTRGGLILTQKEGG